MVLADEPVQFAFPYNVAGTPAISLPLAMHSNGLPIGVQLGAGPAREHVLIALGAALEQAMPWAQTGCRHCTSRSFDFRWRVGAGLAK